MTVRAAISGFGRIGRHVLRAIAEAGRDDIQIVAINSRGPVATGAHLLRWDSTHGRFPGTVTAHEDSLDIGRGPIPWLRHGVPEACPWADLGVDVVLECTGVFTDREAAARHLAGGAGRVLVSAPSTGADATVVCGVNDAALTGAARVVSNGSCTTNGLAPVAKVLMEAVGIERGYMTTILAYTHDQPTLDATHSDLYRARSAAVSMIPTKTGAAAALGLVLPELAGRLEGSAIRVPVPNVSAVDLSFLASRDTTAEEINAAFTAAAEGPMAGILGVTAEKLVSVDFNHDPRSSIVALDQTRVTGGRFARVLAWYDNEWGFSNRMVDLTVRMGRLA